MPSNFDEKLDNARDPIEVAQELALGKAMEIATLYPGSLVIGSDTIVTIDGEQLEKPHDAEEAHVMLHKLSGKPNFVTTGLAVICVRDNVRLLGADTTKVVFKPYDTQAVADYIASGDPFDKAGGYGIQSGAAPLIDHIEGQYDTVVGLPTHLLAEFLGKVGIHVRPVELPSPVRQTLA